MYAFLKLLHVAAVVIFLGNIITGLFWHSHALRTGDARLLAHTMHGIIRSDRLLTAPGVIIIIATGVAAAFVGHLPLLRTGWILWTIVLFTVSGVVFALRVAPLQRRLYALAQAGASLPQFDLAGYRVVSRSWKWWGALALLTPAAGLVLMVLKPTLTL